MWCAVVGAVVCCAFVSGHRQSQSRASDAADSHVPFQEFGSGGGSQRYIEQIKVCCVDEDSIMVGLRHDRRAGAGPELWVILVWGSRGYQACYIPLYVGPRWQW